MNEKIPTFEEWDKLYQAAVNVKEIAPWKWMEESDIFGIQNPETNDLGFVSIMGILGKHYAVSVYLGSEGLYGFWDLEEAGISASPEMLLEIPQLQASFEDRNNLQQNDLKIIRKLGFKFRGRNEWPMFRNYRPSFVPWFLDAGEVRFLTHALEQTIDIVSRFGKNPSLLKLSDEKNYLVRVPHQENGVLRWEDRIMHIQPPEPFAISISMNLKSLDALKNLPQSKCKVELDFFMSTMVVKEKNIHPFYPYIFMMVDSQTGIVLGNDLLSPHPSLRNMWGSIPVRVADQLVNLGIVPKEILVCSELLFQLLLPLSRKLGITLRQSHTLPGVELAKKSLLQFLENDENK